MQQNREKKIDVAYQVDIGLDFVEFSCGQSYCVYHLHQRVSFLAVTEVRMIEESCKIYGNRNLREKVR